MAQVEVIINCTMCGKPQTVRMRDTEYAQLQGPRRKHIQDILPYHRPEERELFVSGTCSKCWDRMFKPMEEDDL